jgi:TatD DNase family protein
MFRGYDAHNHLQDDRFGGRQAGLLAECRQAGVVRMVVNGAAESDWPAVLRLARQYPEVRPSFGYHPWYLAERTGRWLETLESFLDQIPSAVGEIGLDRWKPGLAYEGQEEAFTAQLRVAAAREVPVSIHCLQAWGKMLELLQNEPRPARGFLLHSYGGPVEMVSSFVALGGYFSFPGYYAHARKTRQREAFRAVPLDRLLIETDAPDQMLPPDLKPMMVEGGEDPPVNHPVNLRRVYEFVATERGLALDEFSAAVEQNFLRLFGGLESGRRS